MKKFLLLFINPDFGYVARRRAKRMRRREQWSISHSISDTDTNSDTDAHSNANADTNGICTNDGIPLRRRHDRQQHRACHPPTAPGSSPRGQDHPYHPATAGCDYG